VGQSQGQRRRRESIDEYIMMNNSNERTVRRISRREMLLASTACATAVSSRARADTATAPAGRLGVNDRIRVGLIGCGSRGPYVGYIFQSMPNVELAAVCDVHRGHMGAAAQQAEKVSGQAPRQHGDYRRLL
jgi:hypothetical protein